MKRTTFACYGFLLAIIVSGCLSSDPIQMVKKGTLEFDKSVTVGNALNGYKYFNSTKWTSFQDSQKRTIVQFDATYDYNKFIGTTAEDFEPLTADMINKAKTNLGTVHIACVVQFAISTDKKTFEIVSSSTKISGTIEDTGKPDEKNFDDENYQELKRVYNNQPSLTVWGLLFRAALQP